MFDLDGKGLDIGLTVITGEVNEHWAVTVDQAQRGDIPCHDGVLVDDLTVVGLNVTRRQTESMHIRGHLQSQFIHF